MPQPPEYVRNYSFTAFATSNPTDPLPGNKVDAELNAVKQTTDAIRTNLALIQRDDGALSNDSVGVDQLKPEVSLGFNAVTQWQSGADYLPNNGVWYNGKLYRCLVGHTSDADFAVDLAADRWEQMMDLNAQIAIELTAVPVGSAAAPGIAFAGNNDTGIFRAATNTLAFSTGGSERVRITSAGNVGIGTSNPIYPLDVTKNVIGGTVDFRLYNTDNTNGDSHGLLRIRSGGDSGGDPILSLAIAGGEEYTIGIDNSDGDKFKICDAPTVGVNSRIVIDSGGRIGFGTDTPSRPLHILNATPHIRLEDTGDNTATVSFLEWYSSEGAMGLVGYNSGGNADLYIQNSLNANIQFLTNGTEKGRFLNTGEFLVGKTSSDVSVAGSEIFGSGFGQFTRSGGVGLRLNRLTSDGDIAWFDRSGTRVGSISVTTTATAYNTSSDARLKSNIQPAGDVGSIIDALQIRRWDWKAGGDGIGVIAQEAAAIVPEAITHGDDNPDLAPGDKGFEPWAADYSKLVPYLWAEAQSLRQRVAALEAA